MQRRQGQSHRTLVRAVEVAIAAGDLPPAARGYRKVDLLEALSDAMGLARNALRNLYYRDEGKLDIVLHGYISHSGKDVTRGLRELQFHSYAPIVWKRPARQMRDSRRSLPTTLVLLQAAEKSLREIPDPPAALRREVGTVAAEIMACALTFYDGRQRWELLQEGERIFKSAMGPLSMEVEVAPEDAILLAKFWENRATICGLKWSDIWDDPSLGPTVTPDVVALAQRELDHAAQWATQHRIGSSPDESERLRQLLADKAKWLAKLGRFDEAWRLVNALGDSPSVAARSDRLLLATLEHIINGRLLAASRTAGELAELCADASDSTSLASVTSTILVHNIELLRGRTPALTSEIETFLAESPVLASEMVNLPRYKERLAALGYKSPAPVLN